MIPLLGPRDTPIDPAGGRFSWEAYKSNYVELLNASPALRGLPCLKSRVTDPVLDKKQTRGSVPRTMGDFRNPI